MLLNIFRKITKREKITNLNGVKSSLNRKKLLLWLIIPVTLTIGTLIYLAKIQDRSLVCSMPMEKISPDILKVPSEYKKVSSELDKQIIGSTASYTISSESPTTTYTIKDSQGNEYTLKTTLITEGASTKPKTSGNKVTWKNIFNNVNLEYETYENYVKETFTIKNEEASRGFVYELEKSPNLILDDSEGGYIAAMSAETAEILFMLKAPQGIDARNNRIDYRYLLDGNKLTVELARPHQISCASFPVKVDPTIASVEWDEALVMVGQYSDAASAEKDGDVIDIRPAGWNWGLEERKKFVIVKIPKLPNEETRHKYKQKSIERVPEDNPEGIVRSDEMKKIESDVSALILYGIDYTKIATPEQLAQIRNPEVESPILDARDNPNVIIQKTDFKLSTVQPSLRLASIPVFKTKNPLKKLANGLVKDASRSEEHTSELQS